MTLLCPSCAAEQRPGAAFCRRCGVRLAAQTSSARSTAPESVRTSSRMLWLAMGTYFVLLAIDLVLTFGAGLRIEEMRIAQVVLACLALITLALTANWNALPVARAFAWPENLSVGLLARIAAGMAGGLAAGWLLGQVMPLSDAGAMAEYRAEGQPLSMALLDISVIAPLLEEVVFRGILLGALLRPFSRSGALWSSSLMFATMHLTPLTFVHHTLLGLVAGYARLETRSLVLPILIHATYNAVIVLTTW